MKLKKWVEAILIGLLLLLTFKMFMVDEIIGCLIFILNIIIISILDYYGTLINELNAKLSYFMNEE